MNPFIGRFSATNRAVTSCVECPAGSAHMCLSGAPAHSSSVSLSPGGLGRGSCGGDLSVLLALRCRCVRCGCGRRLHPEVLCPGPGCGSPAPGRLRSPQGSGTIRLFPSRWARVLRELLALPQASAACGTRSLPGLTGHTSTISTFLRAFCYLQLKLSLKPRRLKCPSLGQITKYLTVDFSDISSCQNLNEKLSSLPAIHPPSVEAPSPVPVKHADSPGLHLIYMRQAQLEQCPALGQQFSGSPGPQPIRGQYKSSLSLIEDSNKAASLQPTAQRGNCCFRKHRPLQSRNIVRGHAP